MIHLSANDQGILVNFDCASDALGWLTNPTVLKFEHPDFPELADDPELLAAASDVLTTAARQYLAELAH